jgi:hypothetical protein
MIRHFRLSTNKLKHSHTRLNIFYCFFRVLIVAVVLLIVAINIRRIPHVPHQFHGPIYESEFGLPSNDVGNSLFLSRIDQPTHNANHSSPAMIGANDNAPLRDNCTVQFLPDRLIGRCFGLTTSTAMKARPDLKRRLIVSADGCMRLCCELGDQCITWQYWTDSGICKVGARVRLGDEAASMALWCEPLPPQPWAGRRLVKRSVGQDDKEAAALDVSNSIDKGLISTGSNNNSVRSTHPDKAVGTSNDTCSWGESVATQCFGLGPERKSTERKRLSEVLSSQHDYHMSCQLKYQAVAVAPSCYTILFIWRVAQ